MSKYKPQERFDWIERYMRQFGIVDILDADFVISFIEQFPDCNHQWQPYGAPRCVTVQRDLKRMYDDGVLKRHRTGLPYDMRGLGFPLWVWSYGLRHA